MTAGSPPHPVRTFDDVLDQGYKVIMIGGYQLWLLRNAKNGTAKHKVYKMFFEKDDKKIVKYLEAIYFEKKNP